MANPTVPAPAPPTAGGVAARFDLTDRRTLAGLGVLCFCAGIMVGARLMRGVELPVPGAGHPGTPAPGTGDPAPVPPPAPYVDQPCAGCRERELQAARAIMRQTEAKERTETADITADAEARAAATERQQVPPEGMRTFSAYAESTLPDHLVEQATPADSSLPSDQQ